MSFFRAFFLLLVFANLVFFAWTQGYFGEAEPGREPQRLSNQLEADRLRVIAADGAGDRGSGALANAGGCRLVTGLPLAEADFFKAALADSTLSVDIKPVEESSSYWVHIPAQASKADAEKKAAELKALGISDYYIVLDERASRFAISLGLFKTEAAANEFLQTMGKRGVKSARIEVREATPQHARAVVKGSDEALDKRLPELVAKVAGAAVAACP